MPKYAKYVDFSFDNDFRSIKCKGQLQWLPWVGCSYSTSSSRLLILGESAYNWRKEEVDYKRLEERMSRLDYLRTAHGNNAIIKFNRKSSYVRNIERALFSKKNIRNSDTAKVLWTHVIYHNLVLKRMKNRKQRPTYRDYCLGWETLFELAKFLKFCQCIVYGLEENKLKSFKDTLNRSNIKFSFCRYSKKIGNHYPRTAKTTIGGQEIKFVFIRHPSAYFSWRKWGEFIQSELFLDIFPEQ